MSAEFTPGPWRYIAGQIKADGLGPRAGLIANVAISFKDSATRDANAHLIAAAPDYDAFTEKALPLLETLHSLTTAADTRAIVWNCIKAGREAQAKARGEQ